MAQLRIKVGASLDRSFDTVLRQMADATARANRKIAGDAERTGTTQVKAARATGNEQEKAAKAAAKATEKAQTDASKAIAREWAEEARQFQRSMKAKQQVAKEFSKETQQSFRSAMGAFNGVGRQYERDMDRAIAKQRAAGRVERRATVNAIGSGVGTGLGIASSAVGYGLSVAGDLARGAGVDLSLSSQVAKNIALETMAVKVSNSGFMPGAEGPNGKRVSPSDIAKQSRAIGQATGFDAGDVATGFDEFTALSGDLDTARKVMGDLAMLSKATGTELGHMAAAAGNMDMELGDIPNKAQVISQVMRAIAGQGKLGAVEVKDMASQMAKLAASAGRFEGDVGQNIVLMGAFAQEARQRGGAASATQAATSAQALINTLVTPARMARFQEITGKKVTNAEGFVRNPETLLMEALHATKGDPEAFKKIFANVAGGRAVEGFATIYRQEGGGERGEQAVRAEFDHLKQVAMAQGEVAESFKAAMATQATQATEFNAELSKMTAELQTDLAPAMKLLASTILDFARDVKGPIEAITGVKAVRESKEAAERDIAIANAGGVRGYLNRAALAGGNIPQGTVDEGEAAISALDQSIQERQKKVADEVTYDMAMLGRRSPKTDADAAQLDELKTKREELRGTLDFVKGELRDGFRELKDGVLTVKFEGNGAFMGPPSLQPFGVTPPNAKDSP